MIYWTTTGFPLGRPEKQKPGTRRGEADEARRSRAARANGPEKPALQAHARTSRIRTKPEEASLIGDQTASAT